MRTEQEIRIAIRTLKEKASIIEFQDGTTKPRPPMDCGWAIYGDRIDALLWVLEKQDTIAGHKIIGSH